MTFDVDAAAARHQKHLPFGENGRPYCRCGQLWPCDAAQALDVIRNIDELLTIRRPELLDTPHDRAYGKGWDDAIDAALADLKARQP